MIKLHFSPNCRIRPARTIRFKATLIDEKIGEKFRQMRKFSAIRNRTVNPWLENCLVESNSKLYFCPILYFYRFCELSAKKHLLILTLDHLKTFWACVSLIYSTKNSLKYFFTTKIQLLHSLGVEAIYCITPTQYKSTFFSVRYPYFCNKNSLKYFLTTKIQLLTSLWVEAIYCTTPTQWPGFITITSQLSEESCSLYLSWKQGWAFGTSKKSGS